MLFAMIRFGKSRSDMLVPEACEMWWVYSIRTLGRDM